MFSSFNIFILLLLSVLGDVECSPIGLSSSEGFESKYTNDIKTCTKVVVETDFRFDADCKYFFSEMPLFYVDYNSKLEMSSNVFENGGGLYLEKERVITFTSFNNFYLFNQFGFEQNSGVRILNDFVITDYNVTIDNKFILIIEKSIILNGNAILTIIDFQKIEAQHLILNDNSILMFNKTDHDILKGPDPREFTIGNFTLNSNSTFNCLKHFYQSSLVSEISIMHLNENSRLVVFPYTPFNIASLMATDTSTIIMNRGSNLSPYYYLELSKNSKLVFEKGEAGDRDGSVAFNYGVVVFKDNSTINIYNHILQYKYRYNEHWEINFYDNSSINYYEIPNNTLMHSITEQITFHDNTKIHVHSTKLLFDNSIFFYNKSSIVIENGIVSVKERIDKSPELVFEGSSQIILKQGYCVLQAPLKTTFTEECKVIVEPNTIAHFDAPLKFKSNSKLIVKGPNSEIRHTGIFKFYGESEFVLEEGTSLTETYNKGYTNREQTNWYLFGVGSIDLRENSNFISKNPQSITFGVIETINYASISILSDSKKDKFFKIIKSCELSGSGSLTVSRNIQFYVEPNIELDEATRIEVGREVLIKTDKTISDIPLFSTKTSYVDINSNFLSTTITSCYDIVGSEGNELIYKYFTSPVNSEMLDNKKVLRICPTEGIRENDIYCSLLSSNSSEDSFQFSSPSCPCYSERNQSNCYYKIDEDEYKYMNITSSEDSNFTIASKIEVLNFIGKQNNSQIVNQIPSIINFNNEIKITFEKFDQCKRGVKRNSTHTHFLLKCLENFKKETIESSIKINSETFIFDDQNNYKYIVLDNGRTPFTISEVSNLNSQSIIYSTGGFIMDKQSYYCSFGYANKTTIDCLRKKVIECEDGFYEKGSVCEKCIFENCKVCNETRCDFCLSGYVMDINSKCIEASSYCLFANNNICYDCKNGGYWEGDSCQQCSTNCLKCNKEKCLICSNTTKLSSNGICEELIFPITSSIQSNIISCENGYYSDGNECFLCSENCLTCDKYRCMRCKQTYILNSNGFCERNNCSIENPVGGCDECLDGFIFDESKQCVDTSKIPQNCKHYYSSTSPTVKCVECSENYFLYGNQCYSVENEYCLTSTTKGCLQCKDGMFVGQENTCEQCDLKCLKCSGFATQCLSCAEGNYLDSENHCVSNKNLKGRCENIASFGCLSCSYHYYNYRLDCFVCDVSCGECINSESCINCNSTNFLSKDKKCLPRSLIEGCVVNVTEQGCSVCLDGYYLDINECKKCQESCSKCNSNYCYECNEDYVMDSFECKHYSNIDHCKEAKNSECTKCSFWFTPNKNKNGCQKQAVWWFILIICVIVIILICLFVFGIWKLVVFLFKMKLKKEQEHNYAVFLMEKSNVIFLNKSSKLIVCNKNKIDFGEGEEIDVGEETRELICIGNKTKHTIKVQFTFVTKDHKYSLRTNPNITMLNKGEACEFEIFIKPLCTCEINDKLLIISKSMKYPKEYETSIPIGAFTKITTKLDPDVIKEDKKIGEGSFGIVYLGTFRGNKVAIKKIKQVQDNEEKLIEFENEVSMLDKFRSEYIIHFYGAVFIPNKICMVTEFAEFGSLQDLIHNEKFNQPRLLLKIKFLLDSAKGIEYLHSNGILHRDIKPDNILVTSLDLNENVNAKLTDFGSSRNINMLMTNMTFTKGVGTPIYMAPEILNRQKYKKPADIYSFAITMYEVLIWKEPYPSNTKPWTIADNVSSGKRLSLIIIPEPFQELIKESWKQDPKERLSIELITTKLTAIQSAFN